MNAIVTSIARVLAEFRAEFGSLRLVGEFLVLLAAWLVSLAMAIMAALA